MRGGGALAVLRGAHNALGGTGCFKPEARNAPLLNLYWDRAALFSEGRLFCRMAVILGFLTAVFCMKGCFECFKCMEYLAELNKCFLPFLDILHIFAQESSVTFFL